MPFRTPSPPIMTPSRNRLNRPVTLLPVVLLALLACGGATAQPRPSERPLVGLALSGGGAKGLAHVGVLKVLEAAGVPVGVVTGTSMGSIIGGLYATGYTPAQIEDLVLEQNWHALFGDLTLQRVHPVDPRVEDGRLVVSLPLQKGRPELPSGLVAGQQISLLLSRLLMPVNEIRDFRRLPIPFACVATDLETGRGVRLDQGSLPRAIRASSAIPSIFAPVTYQGRTYIDGGVARNLPAEDARALGADVVLCVDVSENLLPADSLHSLVDILRQAATFQTIAATRAQLNYCDVVITPDLRGFDGFSYDRAAALIQRGEAATRAKLPALQAFAGAPARPAPPTPHDTLFVRRLVVEHLAPPLEDRVRSVLNLTLPARLTLDDLEDRIRTIYRLQLFDAVTYRFDADTLFLEAIEAPREYLGAAMRYESHLKASILLHTSFRNRLRFGSRLGAEIRLGDVFRTNAFFAFPVYDHPRLDLRLSARFTDVPFDLFENNVRVTRLRVETWELGLRTDLRLSEALLLSAGLRSEWFNADQSVGRLEIDRRRRGLFGGSAVLLLNTFDRLDFPTRGFQVMVQSAAFNRVWGSAFTFSHHAFHGRARFPLSSRLTLLVQFSLGHNRGADVPLHYRFYLGGSTVGAATAYALWQERQLPLLGFERQQRAGSNLQMAGLGLQTRVYHDFHLALHWNAARLSETWPRTLDPAAFRSGFGLQVGTPTRIGPLQVTLMSRRPDGPYALNFELGYRF